MQMYVLQLNMYVHDAAAVTYSLRKLHIIGV